MIGRNAGEDVGDHGYPRWHGRSKIVLGVESRFATGVAI